MQRFFAVRLHDANRPCSSYCRSACRVLDVAVADQDPVIREVVAALLGWLDLVGKTRFVLADEVPIAKALRRLQRALLPFAAIGVSVNTPKMHRADDMFRVITRFGGTRHVSTDAYEMAHKTLKCVMRRCDFSPFLNRTNRNVPIPKSRCARASLVFFVLLP